MPLRQLLERDAELAALGSGGLVVVEGAPGAGKTALLDAFRFDGGCCERGGSSSSAASASGS